MRRKRILVFSSDTYEAVYFNVKLTLLVEMAISDWMKIQIAEHRNSSA